MPSKLPFLALLLLLSALLFAAGTAGAAQPVPATTPFALEEGEGEALEEEEEEEAELEEVECEFAEEELEEGLLTPAEAAELCEPTDTITPAPAVRCPLRSTRVRAVQKRNRLKVTVGYTSSTPTSATIEVRSGKKRLASVHRRLGRSGVIRLSRQAGRGTSHRVVVRLKIKACKDLQVTAKIR